MDSTKLYKVFISYSWTNEIHKEWVKKLAEDLVSHGIDVVLDIWNLKPGHDKFKFMEQMVNDESITKVLIIIDKGYKQKADTREGGVGSETYVITPELLNDANQEKFIPIIREKGLQFDDYIPHYLKSRFCFDFTDDFLYSQKFEELGRLIVDNPIVKKPKLGMIPERFLQDVKDEKLPVYNRYILMGLNELNYESLMLNWQNFLDDFIEEVYRFINSKKTESTEPDDFTYETIEQLNDTYFCHLKFIEGILKYDNDNFIDNLISFFEKLLQIAIDSTKFPKLEMTSVFQFLTHEIFLSTITQLFSNKRYNEIDRLLGNTYFVEKHGAIREYNFAYFRFHLRILDETRNNRLKLNRVSITADMLTARAKTYSEKFKVQFIDTDILLHYISKARNISKSGFIWFPATYIYKDGNSIEWLSRLKSKEYSLKFLRVFDVNSIAELKKLINEFTHSYRGYDKAFESIVPIQEYIDAEQIATLR